VQKILKEPINLFRLFLNDRVTGVFDQVDTHQASTCPVLHRFECTGRLVHAPFAGAGYVASGNMDGAPASKSGEISKYRMLR
jgi:hypothetical protein